MVDFCFKQKTAYEMRISDWSSDVCSSDLVTFTGTGIWDISRTWIALLLTGNCTDIESIFHRSVTNSEGFDLATVVGTGTGMNVAEFAEKIGKPDRKSVVEGKSVSVRVDLGGRRIIKKKIK